jgi:hypothetical protein
MVAGTPRGGRVPTLKRRRAQARAIRPTITGASSPIQRGVAGGGAPVGDTGTQCACWTTHETVPCGAGLAVPRTAATAGATPINESRMPNAATQSTRRTTFWTLTARRPEGAAPNGSKQRTG